MSTYGGLAAVAAMVLLIGCGSYSAKAPQPAKPADARTLAFNVTKQVIQATKDPSRRIADFLTWETRASLKSCPPPSPSATLRLGSLGFYYDSTTRKRLCEAAITGAPSPVLFDPGVWKWWEARGRTPDRIAAFPVASRAVAVFWSPISRPQNAGGVMTTVMTRSASGDIVPRDEVIDFPASVLQPGAGTPDACNPALPALKPPKPAPANARKLDDFYWIRLRSEDQPLQGYCGDFLLLVGLHVIEKQPDGRWLWSTMWWDPESPSEFKTASFGEMEGAGSNPKAWKNYAQDAAFGTTKLIFNPWKEAKNSNCEFCHRHALVPTTDEPSGSGDAPIPTPSLSFDQIFAAQKIQSAP